MRLIRNLTGRELARAEVEKIWTIDRAEVINGIYYLEEGRLVRKAEHYDMHGWPPGDPERYNPILYDCFDRGGWFLGLFDESRLVGVAILEVDFIGREKDQLQLKFLHVSHAYRDQGLGTSLFELSAEQARRLSARQLYISSTPSENTVNSYLRMGCRVTPEPDPALYELEPEDIHLVYDLEREG